MLPQVPEPDPEPKLIGVNPTPAALIDVGDNDELYDQLAKLFPRARRVTKPGEVAEGEWDVVVTTQGVKWKPSGHPGGFASPSPRVYASHLFVVAFGHVDLGWAESELGAGEVTADNWRGSIEEQLQIPAGLPPDVERLVERDLVPQAQQRDRQPEIHFAQTPVEFVPFLTTGTGTPIAGRFRRDDELAECWALPEDVKLHTEWVRLALRHWRELAPERFQDIPGWERRAEWMTAEEAEISRAIADVDEELAAVTTRLEQERERLTAQLTAAQTHGAKALRRLLTADGDELTDVVIGALEQLGFQVIDVDDEIAAEGDLTEDLRITDPDVDGWVALAEVKGSTRGASSRALTQIWKNVIRYVAAGNPEPDAVWYIVNQLRDQDPDRRPEIFASKQDVLDGFSDSGGVAIDTAVLFRLVRAVEDGEFTPEEARERLRKARGRFSFQN